MSFVESMRLAVKEATSANAEILRLAAAFERHVETEDARIKRRLERIDAREERILALCERIKATADERYASADVPGLSVEERYRLIGEGNACRQTISLIEQTYR